MNKLRVIWAAIVLSTVIYFAVIWTALYTRPFTRPFSIAVMDPMTLTFYALGAVAFIAAFVVSGRIDRASYTQALRATIVRLALIESICIFGLVTAFMAQDWRLYVPPFALAMVGFLSSFPPERYR